MRICLFTPTFLPLVGGAERDADVIARGLCGRGHDVMVLAAVGGGDHDEPAPYLVKRYRRPPKQHWLIGLVGAALRRAYQQWPFDVVLAFYGYPNGYAAARINRDLGVPLVVSPRGGDLLVSHHALSKPRVKHLIREGYRRADRIVTISEWLGDRVREMLGDSCPPIDLVYNGIDVSSLDAERAASRTAITDPPIEVPFLLHLGGVKPVKRQDLAVDAIAKARDVFENRGLRYAIVGDGKSMSALRDQVRRHSLEHIVRFLGIRTGLEKAWLLDHAEFMVATSKEEGLGNVTLEAMASGLPMLASDIGPHRELIADLGWGLLFKSGDANALAAKFNDMLEADRDAWRKVALRCRDRFSMDAMVAGYEHACEVAAAGRTARCC